MTVIGNGYEDRFLSESEVRDMMAEALEQADLTGRRVLILLPDATRTAPIPIMVRLFQDLLAGRVAALDYLVALARTNPWVMGR